eukprot:3704816-Rhodomonas_salina.1
MVNQQKHWTSPLQRLRSMLAQPRRQRRETCKKTRGGEEDEDCTEVSWHPVRTPLRNAACDWWMPAAGGRVGDTTRGRVHGCAAGGGCHAAQ